MSVLDLLIGSLMGGFAATAAGLLLWSRYLSKRLGYYEEEEEEEDSEEDDEDKPEVLTPDELRKLARSQGYLEAAVIVNKMMKHDVVIGDSKSEPQGFWNRFRSKRKR